MTNARFLQIHTLHAYPAALLNRDDSGLAKRMPYGGAVRTRISSQCLKRHWRVAEDEFALHNIPDVEAAVRSRDIVTRRVIDPLRNGSSPNEEVVNAVEEAFQKGVYGDSGTERSGRQPLLLGLPEVEYLREKAATICTEHPEDVSAAQKAAKDIFNTRSGEGGNFRAMRETTRLPGGLVGALFGRMVTSDPAANIDAAIHVAHAFTVHAEESESDYFSVVDDLQGDEDDPGAAHIGDMELTAGLFYGYVVVDLPGLVSNLEGCDAQEWDGADKSLAGKVIEHLVHLIATVSPGAKLGSTAPYAYADLMLIEAGSRQPRSLANAFRTPTPPQTAQAAGALALYLDKLDSAYGVRETRRLMSLEKFDIPGADRVPLDELANWASNIFRAENGEN